MTHKYGQSARIAGISAILTIFISIALMSAGQDVSVRQDPSLSAAQGSAARFEVHSDLVLVPVTVTTGRGKPVAGLAKEDFTVLEDSVAQNITHFTSEEAPATIGIVFDASDSMSPRMANAKKAVYALLQSAIPGDEFFLIRFSTRPQLKVGLTQNIEEIRRATENLEVSGSTALLDSLRMAFDQMNQARYPRKAVVLISDGEDNCSHTPFSEFKRLVTENDTTVYSLFIGEMPDTSQYYTGRVNGALLLADIAHQTGGQMFHVPKPKHLPEMTAKIGSWIRCQYVLGYVPSGDSRNGKFHKIQVKISKPRGFPSLHSTWRRGYTTPG